MTNTRKQASYKGIPFYVESDTVQCGRRVASHVFPYFNKPVNEDFGRKQRAFSFDAFLVGTDFASKRDALIQAAEEQGSGELVHPYLGRMQVNLVTCSVSHTSNAGRFCKISLGFLESGDELSQQKTPDKAAQVNAIADDVKSKTGLDKTYAVIQAVSDEIKRAEKALQKVMDNIQKVQKMITDSTQIFTDLSYLIRNAKSNAEKIANSPSQVSALISGSLAALDAALRGRPTKAQAISIAALVPDIVLPNMFFGNSNTSATTNNALVKTKAERAEKNKKQLSSLKSLYQADISDANSFHPKSNDSMLVSKNIATVQRTIRILTLSSACALATSCVFLTADDVESVISDLMDALDALLSDAELSDDLFYVLTRLRSNTYEALCSVSDGLPRMQQFKVNYTQTLFHFCYDHFQSLDGMEDIISRNNIADPAWLTMGTTLNVAC